MGCEITPNLCSVLQIYARDDNGFSQYESSWCKNCDYIRVLRYWSGFWILWWWANILSKCTWTAWILKILDVITAAGVADINIIPLVWTLPIHAVGQNYTANDTFAIKSVPRIVALTEVRFGRHYYCPSQFRHHAIRRLGPLDTLMKFQKAGQ